MMATRLLITGTVQGVGFRAHTERAAGPLGIRGHVRNLPDGRVEVVAAGAPDRLRLFIERVREGPRAGRVEGVEVSETTLEDACLGFEIHF
jgi:acylphosphatase